MSTCAGPIEAKLEHDHCLSSPDLFQGSKVISQNRNAVASGQRSGGELIRLAHPTLKRDGTDFIKLQGAICIVLDNISQKNIERCREPRL